MATRFTDALPEWLDHSTTLLDCLLYARVSTEEQADKGYSLDTQEKLCRDFAERNGYRVAGVFRDEGKSGTKLDRPALQDLLAKCTKGTTVVAVVVQETDRLARNTHDHLTIRALLRKAGVKLIAVNQPMLDDSPEGKMIDTILASVNQFQSDINSRKTRKALQEKFNQGWWPGWAPLGYLNVAMDNTVDGLRARKIIKNDPHNWTLLQEGFQLYLTGNYSADRLRDILYQKGLRSKLGKKIPHSIMVHVLKNPFYAGLMVWKGQSKRGRHEPMISLDEHRRVQEIIASHNLYTARTRKHNFLLRGFVVCGICGQRLTAEVHAAKHKSYYHCAAMRKHSNRNQNVEVAELERQVEEKFRTIQFSSAFNEHVEKMLRQFHDQQKRASNVQKQAFLNQCKAVEARRDRAEEKLLAGVLSDDAFVRLQSQFTAQLNQIQERIGALDAQQKCDIEVVRHVLNLSRNVHAAYKKAPAALKRHYLGIFWERFVIRDREIVEAVPTELIRALLAEKEVITSSNWLPN